MWCLSVFLTWRVWHLKGNNLNLLKSNTDENNNVCCECLYTHDH
jgi:hypothetical protein